MAENNQFFIEREQNKYEVVIGLEVHAQVTSASKLFSSSPTKFGAEPNTQVSLVDAAFPGMLPVINEFCVKQAIKTGIGLKAKINKKSIFDRKNYFYADLPQGYQISQYKYPIIGEGKVILDMPDGQKEIGIERLHLEQDAGKSIHDIDPTNTFVDLNRSGVALMEIVSKPDLRSPDEVNAYIKKLRSIMRYLGTCDGNMQEGSLRADVNVSVRRQGDDNFGTRCEIKNVNSIKFMQMAIIYEANRQVDLIEEGKSIDQETRLFDTKKNETRSMRSKEDAHDYRYFPDPDLPPLELDENFINDIKKNIPEFSTENFENNKKLYRTIWISDTHLGTSGSKSSMLLEFLDQTDSEYLFLVGDIIDGWRMRKKMYWHQEHNDVVQKILKKAKNGTKVTLIPGNHDELLKDFTNFSFASSRDFNKPICFF